MKPEIVTALFNINRDKNGDGRKMSQYLEWFDTTLKLKTPMSIFIEEDLVDFVKQRRDLSNTKIFVQKLDEIPFFKWNEKIDEIINSDFFKSKMKDTDRIECKTSLYNVIQYSKFGWIKKSIEDNVFGSDYFLWMDAGCSRFFDNFDLNNTWPNTSKLKKDKFIIQGNQNTLKYFPNLDIENYIWDNNCTTVGTLFGGGTDIMIRIYNEINKIFENYMIKNNCVNNEQFALSILFELYPEIVDLKIILNGSHLPLFNYLSK
jgi:hypothetical protein